MSVVGRLLIGLGNIKVLDKYGNRLIGFEQLTIEKQKMCYIYWSNCFTILFVYSPISQAEKEAPTGHK